MKLKINGDYGYINPENVTSAFYTKHNDDFQEVQISSSTGFASVKVQNKKEADDIIEAIANYTNHVSKDIDNGNPYVDGFKDGVEYAFKINKETK